MRLTKFHLGLGVLAGLVAGGVLGKYVHLLRHPPAQAVFEKVAAIEPRSRPKICAHRANNVPMYRRARAHFDCVEIDVHVSPAYGGPPAVYHPPDTNFFGLTLEFLLTHEKLPTGRLWLDTKDLSPANWRAYLDLLNRLVPAAKRPDVVVETVWGTADVQPVAAAFRDDGYDFSYYLPTERAADCGTSATPDCDRFRQDVLGTLGAGFSHLSFDAVDYPFVRSIRKDMPASVGLLTWDLSPDWPDRELLDEVDIYIVVLPHAYFN